MKSRWGKLQKPVWRVTMSPAGASNKKHKKMQEPPTQPFPVFPPKPSQKNTLCSTAECTLFGPEAECQVCQSPNMRQTSKWVALAWLKSKVARYLASPPSPLGTIIFTPSCPLHLRTSTCLGHHRETHCTHRTGADLVRLKYWAELPEQRCTVLCKHVQLLANRCPWPNNANVALRCL